MQLNKNTIMKKQEIFDQMNLFLNVLLKVFPLFYPSAINLGKAKMKTEHVKGTFIKTSTREDIGLGRG